METETSATEHSATEHSATEHSATEHSATETSATETSATETSATEHSATEHGPPIPVLSRSRQQQINRSISAAVAALGMGWVALEAAAPNLHVLLPGVKWLPSAVAFLGLLAQAWQKAKDTGAIATTNYSGPATAPLPAGTPMPAAPATQPAKTVYPEAHALPANEPLPSVAVPDPAWSQAAEQVFAEDEETTK